MRFPRKARQESRSKMELVTGPKLTRSVTSADALCHYEGCADHPEKPKVYPRFENKAVARGVDGTKVTSGFGEASANISHDCVIRDQTKSSLKNEGK